MFSLQVAGASLLVPPTSVCSGRTAAYLHGARDLVDDGSPVEVSVPPGVRFGPVAGLRIRRVPLAGPDVVILRRRRSTSGLRTALDIARVESRSRTRWWRSTSSRARSSWAAGSSGKPPRR